MNREIDIVEGRDTGAYFWFLPIYDSEPEGVVDEVFCIDEDDISDFLHYFLLKYFDEESVYNRERYEPDEGYIKHFEWNLTPNYYTYEVLEKMCDEILQTANLLQYDYQNEQLKPYKESSCYFKHKGLEALYDTPEEIEDYLGFLCRFLRHFVRRVRWMMANHPGTDRISVSGP